MKFTANYKDEYGEETITVNLSRNGLDLSTVIRETEFRGTGFDVMVPVSSENVGSDVPFSLCDRSPHFDDHLQEFDLNFILTLTIVVEGVSKVASLQCYVHVPACDAEEDEDRMRLVLKYDQVRLESPGLYRGFEFELGDLHEELGHGSYLKCCFNCRYSAYVPYFNSGMMGDLICFLNSRYKEDRWRGKGYLGWSEDAPGTVHVQEIHLCEHFERG